MFTFGKSKRNSNNYKKTKIMIETKQLRKFYFTVYITERQFEFNYVLLSLN